MSDRPLAWVRIGFATLGLAAITWMISVLVGDGAFDPTRFFAFFTILSNLTAIGVLYEGGRRQLTGSPPVPDLVRGAAVVFMTVTFIVFAVLLSEEQEQLQTHVPWVDTTLHRVLPVVIMLDWLIEPPHRRLGFREAAVPWLGLALLWTALTMIRGALDGYYPYPFLDPENGGYGSVALYAVGITVLFVIVIWVAVTAGNGLRERRRAA